MTIKRLHKELTKLINEGHGRKEVCVDKSHVNHPCEPDGVCLFPVTGASIGTHEMMGEDGGFKELADGTVATRTSLVITAEHCE